MYFGRKLYTLGEIYKILYKGIRTAPYLSKSKRKGVITNQFVERIMIAVTEVNGCAICSYAHTKMALEVGMGDAEIQNMLKGVLDDVPSDEIQAIMFAQHYADSRGNPSKETWDRILDMYGTSKALGILGAIRIIMMGNALGIPWSGITSRLKGKPDERSSVSYELMGAIIPPLMIPFAGIHAIVASMLRIDVI